MAKSRSSAVLTDQLGTLYCLGTIGSLPDNQLVERFLDRNESATSDAAFRALLDRHAGMVLRVCQEVLQNPHDADDAFQATFLVLVQKARAIRRRESVAGWLFRIARRISTRARQEAARRRRHIESIHALKIAANDRSINIIASEADRDCGPLLAEIDRLPDSLRTPVVLHYFEGLSTEAIAERLQCPRGTILSRLARAREQLRRRLKHRGVSFETLMPATAASSRLFASANVPTALTLNTIRAASCLALAGTAIERVVPATVATLARGAVRSLLFANVRLASVLVVLGLAIAAIGLSMAAPADEKPRMKQSQPKTVSEQATMPPRIAQLEAEEQKKGEAVIIRGQVLDPDGNPIAGARIVLTMCVRLSVASSQSLTNSGRDGRFEAPIPRVVLSASDPDGLTFPVIGAWSRGMGPDWVTVDSRMTKTEVTLRLRRDDVPIEGRVLGLEGRPVAGATVSIAYIAELPPELLKRFQDNGGVRNPFLWWGMNDVMPLGRDGLIPAIKTGPDGRFRLTGVGRDRVAYVVTTGESIELTETFVMTSSDPAYTPILLPADSRGKSKLLGPRFDLAVLPGRVIEGVARDRDNGRPIAGAKMETTRWDINTSRSDSQGRYRVIGQPRGANVSMDFEVEGQPYVSERIFKAEKMTGDPTGLGPVRVDFTLKRGVWVEGKVTNRDHGRPVRAVVRYHPLKDNPHLKAWPDGTFVDNTDFGNYAEFPTDASGRFRAVALSGRGILTVRTSERGYLAAEPVSPQVAGNVLYVGNLMNDMKNLQAVVPINPDEGEKTVIPDITLVPGRTQRVQVVGPDGRQVPEIRVFGPLSSSPYSAGGRLIDGAEFSFVHPNPGTAEELEVVQEDKNAGKLIVITGNEPDPIQITLERTGTVTGRLVDDEARPRPFIPIMVNQHLKTNAFWRSSCPLTDAKGRFRITGLIPGIVYSLSAAKNHGTIGLDPDEGYILNDRYRSVMKHQWALKPGETQEWGDVQVKKP